MTDTLTHHGILGQKWGVRRYQNEDGSLTALGKKHVGQDSTAEKRTAAAQKQDAAKKNSSNSGSKSQGDNYNPSMRLSGGGGSSEDDEENDAKKELENIEQQLINLFGGESESLKYIKTNRNKDDPSKTTFVVTSPASGEKSIFTFATAKGMINYLKNELNAKKKTEAAKKQSAAIYDKTTKMKNLSYDDNISPKKLKKSQKLIKVDMSNKSAFHSSKPTESEIKKSQTEETKLKKELDSAKKEVEYLKSIIDRSNMKRTKLRVKMSHMEEDRMDDILVHYGVLGMKWGVRKDATIAYQKAFGKLRKLDVKLTKANEKTEWARAKKNVDTSKASKKGLFTSEEKMQKRAEKANKSSQKYERSYAKSKKAYRKATNWYKSMEKTFKNVDLSNADQSDIDLGQKYAAMIWQNSRKPSRS